MRKPIFLLSAAILLTSLATVHAATNKKSAYVSKQEQADQLYAQGNYSEAMRKYLSLAKQGDSFSQYRVSYMNLEGLGDEADIVEAFAWAYLASQNKQDELIEYRDTVAKMVPQDKQNKAMRKLDYYMRRWGNKQLADDAIRTTKRELSECTGSRLGTRCEEVYAQQMPRFWGINPGNGSEAESVGGSNTASGSRSSVIGGGTGSATRDVAYYQGLRARIDELNRYIGEQSGNVELGEFQVLEEDQQPSYSDESPH